MGRVRRGDKLSSRWSRGRGDKLTNEGEEAEFFIVHGF